MTAVLKYINPELKQEVRKLRDSHAEIINALDRLRKEFGVMIHSDWDALSPVQKVETLGVSVNSQIIGWQNRAKGYPEIIKAADALRDALTIHHSIVDCMWCNRYHSDKKNGNYIHYSLS